MVIPDDPPPGGVEVPLLASFAVLRRVPLIALAHNSLNPKLVLFPGHLEYRVLRHTRRAYDEIGLIDARILPATSNIIIASRGSALAFSGNLGSVEALKRLVSLFKRRGIALAPRAAALVDAG